MDESDFFRLYNPQRQQYGGAIGADGSVFFKAYGSRQRGHGIGGIFGAIARRLLPFLGKHVAPHAKSALANIASDVLGNNRNLKESLKEHGMTALKGVGNSIFGQSGSGIRRRRTTRQKGSGFKKRRSLVKRATRLRKRQKGRGVRKSPKWKKKRTTKLKRKQLGGRLKRKAKKRPKKKKYTRKLPRSIFD